MRFVMMVKSNEKSESGALPDEKMLAEMGRYNGELIKAGMMLGGDGLAASSKGVKVRTAARKTTVVDGPFAEAKELVGGFWLIQAKSQDEAVEWARKVPFKEGEIEIRGLFELEDFPVDPVEQAGGWRDQEKEARAAAAQPFATLNPRQPGTRRYMLMLKADRLTESGATPSEKVLAEMGALMEDLTRQGALLAGEGLKPSAQGKKVKFAGGKTTVIDGPFAESKELIAGYLILQAKTPAEAQEWARRWLEIHAGQPGLEAGEIEVRLLMDLEDYPVDPREQPDGWRDQERKFRDEP
jgi:hypothetical protein